MVVVTCQAKQLFDDFLAGLLSENSVANSLDCPPVEQNFGILGNPLISCPSPTQCNFFCLNGLLIGASRVTCSTVSQSASWKGDNGETFVACIKLFWNKIMFFLWFLKVLLLIYKYWMGHFGWYKLWNGRFDFNSYWCTHIHESSYWVILMSHFWWVII